MATTPNATTTTTLATVSSGKGSMKMSSAVKAMASPRSPAAVETASPAVSPAASAAAEASAVNPIAAEGAEDAGVMDHCDTSHEGENGDNCPQGTVHEETDLAELASQTNAALSAVWDDVGVSAEERSRLLEQLRHRLAAVYATAVEEQRKEQKRVSDAIESEISQIDALATRLGETACVVRDEGRGSKSRRTLVGRAAWNVLQ